MPMIEQFFMKNKQIQLCNKLIVNWKNKKKLFIKMIKISKI